MGTKIIITMNWWLWWWENKNILWKKCKNKIVWHEKNTFNSTLLKLLSIMFYLTKLRNILFGSTFFIFCTLIFVNEISNYLRKMKKWEIRYIFFQFQNLSIFSSQENRIANNINHKTFFFYKISSKESGEKGARALALASITSSIEDLDVLVAFGLVGCTS